MNIVIAQAHGSWEEKNGYVAVPSGTKLHLFQNPGSVMLAANADWAAFQSAETLRDVATVIAKFKDQQAEWIETCAHNWENGIVAYETDPEMEWYVHEAAARLERACAGMSGLAEWTLIEDDIVYDYTIGSLELSDAIYGKGQSPGEGVKMIRSKIAAEVDGGSTVAFVEPGKDMLLSEVFASHKGDEIFWLACQAGAGAQPTKETMDMLDDSKVKKV